jgi:hypothetical protein
MLEGWFLDKLERLYPHGASFIRQMPGKVVVFEVGTKVRQAPWKVEQFYKLEDAVAYAEAVMELERD